jgi:hypothetical protein
MKTETFDPGTIYLARVAYRDGARWVCFDVDRSLRGSKGESRAALVHRWVAAHGTPTKIVRYADSMSVAELAATMTDLTLRARP